MADNADFGDATKGAGLVALGVATENPALIIAGFIELGDFWVSLLFGDGHAGSCGAFRDQYFATKASLDPVFDAADVAFSEAFRPGNPTPAAVMNTMGGLVGPTIDGIDAQFDEFKGRNLLGQTMFTSRTHLLLFKRWIGNAIFASQAWNEQGIDNLIRLISANRELINAIQGGSNATFEFGQNLQDQISNNSARINANASAISVERSVRASQVSALQATIEVVNQKIVSDALPRIAANEILLRDIDQVRLPNVNAKASEALGTINWFINNKLPEINQSIGLHTMQIADLNRRVEQEIRPKVLDSFLRLNALTQDVIPDINLRIQLIEGQVAQIDLTAVQQLQDDLLTANQQIANNTLEIQQVIQPQVQENLDNLQNLNVLVIPSILDQVDQNRQAINEIDQDPNVEQRTLDNQRRIGEIEQQKVTFTLPAIQALQSALQGLQDQVQTINTPQIIQNLNLINQINVVINDEIRARILKLETDITNISVNFLAFIQTNIIDITVNVFEEVGKLPDKLCEFGRKAWGIMAECWLNANTPVSVQEIDLPAEDWDPTAAALAMFALEDEDEESRAYQIQLETFRYVHLPEDEEDDTLPPLFEGETDATHIFVPEPQAVGA